MQIELLNFLECPFCGARLWLEGNRIVERIGNEVITGILLCDCCAFPIVAGIPYIRTGREAERALELIGRSENARALSLLLGLGEENTEVVRAETAGATFRDMLERLDGRAESRYLLYRFSDPTFLTSEAVLLALGSDARCE